MYTIDNVPVYDKTNNYFRYENNINKRMCMNEWSNLTIFSNCFQFQYLNSL